MFLFILLITSLRIRVIRFQAGAVRAEEAVDWYDAAPEEGAEEREDKRASAGAAGLQREAPHARGGREESRPRGARRGEK